LRSREKGRNHHLFFKGSLPSWILDSRRGGPDLKTGKLEAFLGSRGPLVGLAVRGVDYLGQHCLGCGECGETGEVPILIL